MNIYYMVLSVALCMNLLLIGAEWTDCRITIEDVERWPIAAALSGLSRATMSEDDIQLLYRVDMLEKSASSTNLRQHAMHMESHPCSMLSAVALSAYGAMITWGGCDGYTLYAKGLSILTVGISWGGAFAQFCNEMEKRENIKKLRQLADRMEEVEKKNQ